MADQVTMQWGIYSARLRRRVIHVGAKRPRPDQDTRKEQASLMLGSPEYREYVEDLQSHKPVADEMHVDLEAENAAHAAELDMAHRAVEDSSVTKATRKQVAGQVKKASMVTAALDTARGIAKSTPGTQDDRNVEAVGRLVPERFDKLIYDASVDLGTFKEKAVDDALSGPNKYC